MDKTAKQLRPGDKVKATLVVTRKNLVPYSPSSTRSGEKYLKLQLGDASGMIEARVWDNADALASTFGEGDLVYVEGQVVDYMGPQINVSRLEKRSLLGVDPTLYQPTSARNRNEMKETLLELIPSIENPYLQALLEVIFDDQGFLEVFSRAPGGMRVHHAYVGGLLEHTLEVVELVGKSYEMHPDVLDGGLLCAGALLHDIGKVKEYDPESLSFQMTDRGKLIGHVVMGKEMVDEAAAGIKGFPEDLRLEIDHMLLSHHGQKDWGSPEVPKTANAFALFYADLVSARLNQFATLVRNHDGQKDLWTCWDKYLERTAYIPPRSYLNNDAP